MTDLLSVDAARACVLAATVQLPAEPVPLADALGRVLAEDVLAAGDIPPFASSGMDGYAVPAGPAGRRLTIVDEARAGAPASRGVSDGTAIAISTGAVIPDGTSGVIRVEDTSTEGDTVVLAVTVDPGQNIRAAGDDLARGTIAIAAGTTLAPAALGIAVSAGRTSVQCARRPRVAILATGDELVAAGAPLGPGQIHNSNAMALTALVAAAGGEPLPARLAPDTPAGTNAALSAALGEADVVVVTGGVSVGPHDHVKAGFAAAGVQEQFWRVALKPGKPTWFGTRGPTLAFGLPGNPVSAVVCFHLFVKPALRAMQGAVALPTRTSARLTSALPRNPGREEAVRVRLRGGADGLMAEPTGPQGSHQLSSLLEADALAFVGAGTGDIAAGEVVAVEPL